MEFFERRIERPGFPCLVKGNPTASSSRSQITTSFAMSGVSPSKNGTKSLTSLTMPTAHQSGRYKPEAIPATLSVPSSSLWNRTASTITKAQGSTAMANAIKCRAPRFAAS